MNGLSCVAANFTTGVLLFHLNVQLTVALCSGLKICTNTFETMAEADSGDSSKRYEFDAPSHVVSLMELRNSDNDDKWFGTSPKNS